MIEFQEFAKIPRYRREVCLTEKLDGTNAAVAWHPVGDNTKEWSQDALDSIIATRTLVDQHQVELGQYHLLAQSRQRFITPTRVKAKNDNYGFATWVDANADELTKLGPGVHYGEWWGYGIQRGYGVPEKRFSLFNVNRWGEGKQPLPECCHVVPLIGYFGPDQIATQVEALRANGSYAAPGYQRPEGVVVWHSQSKQYYKILLEGDDAPKSLWTAAAAKPVTA
jgi:hypothetical protein